MFYLSDSTWTFLHIKGVKGQKENVDVSCPQIVRSYNEYMGGVDLFDQKKVFYQVDRRSTMRFYLLHWSSSIARVND